MQIPSGRISSGTNEGNGRTNPRENVGSGGQPGELSRETNPSIRYIRDDDVGENFVRVITDSQTRRMIHSTREFPRGPRLFNFSSLLGTNFSAFSCSMHAPNLNMLAGLHACVTRASLHDEWGQYCSADISQPPRLITSWISRTRRSIYLSCRHVTWNDRWRFVHEIILRINLKKYLNRSNLTFSPPLTWREIFMEIN